MLATTGLAVESRSRVDSLLRVITALDFEIDLYARLVSGSLRADPGTPRSRPWSSSRPS